MKKAEDTTKKIDSQIRKIRELGGCYCITLPFQAVKEFGWVNEKELMVDINYSEKQIVIRRSYRKVIEK